ncbi:general secretion pathway protein GspB [Vibrio sp. SCSIO 43135]|uniref:general secretion pathway protein GspB n=1 Tax=Vibrio sp. SCSIO 43135 TaxID=2819096 RepID=UPI00207645B6|nr:general secretion pathway protein GspB [Vibrio sp. SCSIO 43135]USD41593.1 general secretion pathway protein GspB [Vibrio sp. SCSIO 43135]
MSNVLNALKASEQRNKQYGVMSVSPNFEPAQADTRQGTSNWRLCVLAAVMPCVVGLGFAGYQSYQQQKEVALALSVAQKRVVEVPNEFSVHDSPRFEPLMSTFVEPTGLAGRATDENTPTTSESPVVSNQRTLTVEPEKDLVKPEPDDLSQLDLTQLSPELARRVQSVMNQSGQANGRSDNPRGGKLQQNAIKLNHHSSDFIGQLPAMNFQTHVYSSQANKRWVKINDVEYMEGDWIDSRVQLVKIEPQSSIVEFESQRLEIPALYDWQG